MSLCARPVSLCMTAAAAARVICACVHDYNERNFLFLPPVMTTSGRISGDFLRLLYILSHRQAANYLAYFTHEGAF
jgi:hypothetical protein